MRRRELVFAGSRAVALAVLVAAPVNAQTTPPNRLLPPSAAVSVHPVSAAARAALLSALGTVSGPTFSRHRTLQKKIAVVTVHPYRLATKTASSRTVVGAAIDAKKCEDADPSAPSPRIDTIEGQIGSSGDIEIDGACFGTWGGVEFTGTFPFTGGVIVGENRSWSPDTIYVHIPSVRGIYAEPVTIRVLRDTTASNQVTRIFQPEMEDRVIPAASVVSLTCPFYAGECAGGTAGHFARGNGYSVTASDGKPSSLSGDDRWEVKPPKGWLVSWLEWQVQAGDVVLGPDFLASPGDDAVWTMHWENNPIAVGNAALNNPGNFTPIGDGNQQYYAASYSMKVHIVGPLGTLP